MTNGQDQVTVVVFKDDFSSRTFQVPLKWIARLGLTLGLFIGIIVFSTLISLKYYRVAQQAAPGRIEDLEHELAELQTSYRELEVRANAAESTSPLPTTGSVIPPMDTQPLLFSDLPRTARHPLPDSTLLNFKLDQLQANWKGNMLRIRFNIHYVAKDGGSQAGRILVIARGPETFLTYPNQSLNPSGKESLLAPENGEYFSVSRFREGAAEFGPVNARTKIKEIQVLIFDTNGKLLLIKGIEPGPANQEERRAQS